MPAEALRIGSRNNHFQHIETLKRNREKRSQYGEFVLEGVRAINAAINNGWGFRSIAFCSDRPLSDWAQRILKEVPAEQKLDFTLPLLEELSDKEDTSELIAVVKCAPDDLSRIPESPVMLVLLFDRPSSPGNLGSSIRSCDALGAAGVIVTGHASDIYDPVAVRASVGSLLALPVVRQSSPADISTWLGALREKGIAIQIAGTDETGTIALPEADLTRPTLLVMGNETSGMSRTWRELCDFTIGIPMCGSASSLNVSCAASIALYEAARQRGMR